MKHLLFFLLLPLLCCTSLDKGKPGTTNVIPAPSEVTSFRGAYSLPEELSITVNTDSALLVSRFLSEYLAAQDRSASISTDVRDNSSIALNLDQTANMPIEAYDLKVSQAGIELTSGSKSGLFYGIQTLIQLIHSNNGSIPHVQIKDQPRFGYRGMHLDVGRHLFSVDFIKKYIDMMSHFKFNTFHWHLTEDQGWRVEIKKYPKLQEKAAYRNETVIGRSSTKTRHLAQYNGERYGGYYSQDQIKEVVQYASERFIQVIPEIELPGHAQAALTAYPHLGCTGGPYEVARSWGVFQDIYCAGKESTFEFLEDVFDEVLPLFPGKYVHIGGDEAPKSRWEKCPHCQQRMKEEGLADEHELQSYFVQRMEKYLNSKGKTMIGWDEILEGGLAPNAVVMSWRGEEGGIAAAQQNHQVIMTPTTWCYFDYYQTDPTSEPLAINSIVTVEDVYGYEPIPASLTPEQSKYVLGSQCNLWSEYITTEDHAEYMVYPRAMAMAEVIWSPKQDRDYTEFVNRASNLRPLLDFWDINYAQHIFNQTAQE